MISLEKLFSFDGKINTTEKGLKNQVNVYGLLIYKIIH